MADPFSILGGAAAGLQLVPTGAQALLTTLKLIKELRDMPRMLCSLLNEVDDSASRLYSSCSNGAQLMQELEPAQAGRLAQCVVVLHTTLQIIQSMLTPLIVAKPGRAAGLSQLWKSVLYLSMRREVEEKLQRLNRQNIELIRELELIGLENSVALKSLMKAGNAVAKQGFKSIDTKVDLLQIGLRELASSPRMASSEIAGPAILAEEMSDDRERVPRARAEHIRQYVLNHTTTKSHISSPPGDFPNATLEYIIYGIRTFYTVGNFDTSSVVTRSKFWQDIDLAIYLMKVSHMSQRGSSRSQTRGLQILKRSTDDSYSASCSIWDPSMLSIILVELLSTLSPVNTVTCPHVREAMLRHLSKATQARLSGGGDHHHHPIALVIQRLLLQQHKSDKDDELVMTTLRALSFLVERLRATVGPLHELSQLAQYRLCSLLRRNGDHVGTLKVAREGIREIRASLGPGSLQERRLSRHLEHVYMDQGDWVAALSVGLDIVGHTQLDRHADPDPQYHDACAIVTMEDIAKACETAGNAALGVAWLKQARMSGSMLWGQNEAVGHIQDKLGEMLQQTASQAELELWTE